MSSNEAVVGDHCRADLFWVRPGPQAQLFLRSVGVHPQQSQHRHCWGAADRLWVCGTGWTRCNSISCAVPAVRWEQHVQQPRALPGAALLQGGLQRLPQHPLQPHLPAQHQRDLLSLHTALFYQTDPEWWVADPSELPKAAGVRKERKKFNC